MSNEKLSVEFIEKQEQPKHDQNVSQTLNDVKSSEEKELLQLKNDNFRIENQTLDDNREMRKYLIQRLMRISILWLFFTAFIIMLLVVGSFCCFMYYGVHGVRYYVLSDSVTIAFITTSLGTVLGLWVIGLRYFFSPKK
ncbi:MAG: hypothetical protein LBH59_04620 [Planctomycetaceae bacterium]|jgi:hypothetical protein|nr:hypothetical protein [Planctomycetaceae bacterium]